MARSTPTQAFVEIKDVRDGIITLKDNSMRAIILASSINFALKSSDEQIAVLNQFQSFLNTLDFSIQIYVQSRELDIRPYISQLRARAPEQDNDLMKVQLSEYIEFIEHFTSEVDIMKKNFFVVVPYSPQTDMQAGIKKFFGNNASDGGGTADRFEEHRMQLEQRIGIVAQGLNGVGVQTVTLGTSEVTELFYHLYNPNEVNNVSET